MNSCHRPCLVIALIVMLGIVTGEFSFWPAVAWFLFSLAVLAVFFLGRASVVLYILVFCLSAAWTGQHKLLPPDSIAFLSWQERQNLKDVEGVIDSEIGTQKWTRGDKTVFELRVRRIQIGGHWRQAGGKVQVALHCPLRILPQYGDYVRIAGKLHPAFAGKANSGFSYRRYLQEHGIFWVLSVGKRGVFEVLRRDRGNVFVAQALNVRAWMVGIFHRYLAPREAGFVAALVLGDRRGLPKDIKEVFVNTGTAHVLAISGMNMAVVTVVFFFILRAMQLPRPAQFLGTVVILFGYAFLSGWSPSVVRACIMSSVILASFAFEYESEALNSLGAAAIILLVLDPRNMFDIGFQLSFAAVAGILILYPYMEKIFQFLPLFLRLSIGISLSAWLTTAPIIAFHFCMVTPVAVLANIPIVPLADLVMVLGLGLAGFGSWCPYLGHAFAACLKAVLSSMVILATWFNQVPWGHFNS